MQPYRRTHVVAIAERVDAAARREQRGQLGVLAVVARRPLLLLRCGPRRWRRARGRSGRGRGRRLVARHGRWRGGLLRLEALAERVVGAERGRLRHERLLLGVLLLHRLLLEIGLVLRLLLRLQLGLQTSASD